MLYLPLSTFHRCVAEHNGEHRVKDFSCLDQFFAMAFAQLTYRESLRDIEVNLRAQARRLHHTGFRCQTISRNRLANANGTRPCQIYADFAQHLIGLARPLYATEPFGLELDAAASPRVTIVVASLELKNTGAAKKEICGTLRTNIQGPGSSSAVAA